MKLRLVPILVGLSAVIAVSVAQAEDGQYSVGVDKDHPKNVYWGDTHLHTQNSADAYSLMNTMLSPDDAYRFARGQELTAHNGMRVRLRRPLDFLVVSDHASFLGGYYRFFKGDPVYKFDSSVNDSMLFETQGYTTLIQTAPHEALVFCKVVILS